MKNEGYTSVAVLGCSLTVFVLYRSRLKLTIGCPPDSALEVGSSFSEVRSMYEGTKRILDAGSVAVRLADKPELIKTIILAHPGAPTPDQLEAFKVRSVR